MSELAPNLRFRHSRLCGYVARGKKLGGAPANFAYISNLLVTGEWLPAEWSDEMNPGREAVSCVKKLGGETDEIQTDAIHPRGRSKF